MMQAMKWNLASKLLASILLVTAPWMVSVAADSPPTKSDPAWLTDTRASIKSNNYEQALKQLQAANEVNSADWNNLMGYSLRKKQAPDLASSESITRQH
jgi:Flp pilus assembly protein TadD